MVLQNTIRYKIVRLGDPVEAAGTGGIPSICLSVCLSVSLSVSLFVCVSVCLSVCVSVTYLLAAGIAVCRRSS